MLGSSEFTMMTLDEWADLDEDEPGELVDGRLEEEEAPSFLQEALVAWLVWVLGTWAVPPGRLGIRLRGQVRGRAAARP
jgi:hypothetical protein